MVTLTSEYRSVFSVIFPLTRSSWQKRDGGVSNIKTQRPNRKQQRRSPSKSRSRSPAESYYSRHSRPSSRGRSRSIDSVRYRRRADSRAPRSRSPVDRWSDRGGRPSKRYTPSLSRSPTPRRYRSSRSPQGRGRSRERTPYTVYSSSRSRSRSHTRSPSSTPPPRERSRTRTVHRLPTATSLEDVRRWVELPSKSPSRTTNRFSQRNGDGQPKLTKAEVNTILIGTLTLELIGLNSVKHKGGRRRREKRREQRKRKRRRPLVYWTHPKQCRHRCCLRRALLLGMLLPQVSVLHLLSKPAPKEKQKTPASNL